VPLARETGRAHVHRRKQAQPLAHSEPHGSLKHGGAMPAVRQPRITRLPRGQKRGLPVSTPNRAPESTPACRTGRASRAALFASRTVLRDREISRAWGIGHFRGAAPPGCSLALRIAFWTNGPRVPRLPAVAGHRISNRHPCRLEITLSPCASIAPPLLIVTKSGVNLSVFPSYHGSPVTDHGSPITGHEPCLRR